MEEDSSEKHEGVTSNDEDSETRLKRSHGESSNKNKDRHFDKPQKMFEENYGDNNRFEFTR